MSLIMRCHFPNWKQSNLFSGINLTCHVLLKWQINMSRLLIDSNAWFSDYFWGAKYIFVIFHNWTCFWFLSSSITLNKTMAYTSYLCYLTVAIQDIFSTSCDNFLKEHTFILMHEKKQHFVANKIWETNEQQKHKKRV